ncbi:MAG TPA: carboxypeptidase-like regulatory domain-containing protein [Vicinamibacterales bacterium]
MRYIAAILALAASSLLMPSWVIAQGGPAARANTLGGGGVKVVNLAPVSIRGTVLSSTGQPLANTAVQARNLLTGRIAGFSSTTGAGQFSIVGLNAGSYVLEAVDATGQVIGTSSFVSAAAGTTVAVTVIATSGALSAVNTVTGFAATLTTTAAESVKYAAVAAGVAGLVAPVDVQTASPSR